MSDLRILSLRSKEDHGSIQKNKKIIYKKNKQIMKQIMMRMNVYVGD